MRSEVHLVADGVCFSQEAFKLCVDLGGRCEAEVMDVVSWRDRFDLTESGMFVPAGQYHMTVEPLRSGGDLGERHAGLEGDTGFFGENGNRAATLDRCDYHLKELADFWRPTLEMGLQVVLATEMGLISIGERPAAFRALPKWTL
jgi:hypothetical protein